MRGILIVAGALFVSACGPAAPADAFRNDAEAVKRGKALFIGTCAGYCHTTTSGNREAPYLFDGQWVHGGTDQEIFDSIANGIPGTTMIAFQGKLPQGDDDIWRLVAYITTGP
ncbi:MAG: c-type cytochrome [Gammaproteobacteria bacterium]|nr:c-type cytochrome [Gammaproteobacteria bacterium]